MPVAAGRRTPLGVEALKAGHGLQHKSLVRGAAQGTGTLPCTACLLAHRGHSS